MKIPALWLLALVLVAPRCVSADDAVRAELLAARDTAWRAFFEKGGAAKLETILAPELVAIQESAERWEDRPRLLAMAKAIEKQGVQILRLEFPRTEMQIFGDTAILYYTYLFETGVPGNSVTDEGRGTEVFVRRDGRWLDVGWHLDNGAFVRKDGVWVRLGGGSDRSAAASAPGVQGDARDLDDQQRGDDLGGEELPARDLDDREDRQPAVEQRHREP
jgi:uncharacterized protein DUF4440